MTVMIVDDTVIMRMIIKDILIKYAGLKTSDIHEAADGREALKKYPVVKPDLVFLDIAMPDIDGITAVKELMKKDPSAKIIMCTSSTNFADIQFCMQSGAKDYIKKPPRPERVMQAYDKILKSMQSDGQMGAEAQAKAVKETAKPAKAEKPGPKASGDPEVAALRKEVEALRRDVETIKEMLKRA